MSKHAVPAGDVPALLLPFDELNRKAKARTRKSFQIISIQEAGRDGVWLHRLLKSEGVESHVVDPASVATSRRRRRAKTDRLDGEALLRALLAFRRGEPSVCAMAVPPTPEEEDRRRISRQRKTLVAEIVEHTDRTEGLLFSQGDRQLRAHPPRPPRAARRTDDQRRSAAAVSSQGVDLPRTRPARTSAPTNQSSRG